MKLDKYDKAWSLKVRTRDKYTCQVCGKYSLYVSAHHVIRRGIWATKYVVENGVTLCAQCHTFNHTFSAHKTPEAFKKWFREKFKDRWKYIWNLSKKYSTKAKAQKEFVLSVE